MYLIFIKYRFLKKGLKKSKYNKLEMEIWKQVENYENYEVSNYGRVKNTNSGRILKQALGKNGYMKVTLSKNKEKKHKNIHSLVAFAFCDNKYNKNVIDHKDKNRLNNHYTNLRFCTFSENCRNRKGVQGVSYYKNYDKWEAYITVNGKRKGLGYFKTFAEAKTVRLQQEKEIYGEFAPN